MQIVSLVAGALEPHLFKSISIHRGMHSMSYLLNQSVRSIDVPDLFCRDLYRDFDLAMLKAMAEPAVVTESDDLNATSQN